LIRYILTIPEREREREREREGEREIKKNKTERERKINSIINIYLSLSQIFVKTIILRTKSAVYAYIDLLIEWDLYLLILFSFLLPFYGTCKIVPRDRF